MMPSSPSRRRLLLAASLLGSGLLGGAGWQLARRPDAAPAALAPSDEVCIVAPPLPWDSASGLPKLAPRAIPAEARCPVCGMFPARQPRWAAQVIFDDGATQFLDSPLSLFHYLQRVSRYTPGRSAAEIAAVHVRDWDSGEWLALEQALFVHGSRQRGPMRAGNLPAFADAAAARRFIAREGGISFNAAQLRRGLPAELQQLSPHRH